MLLVLSKMFKLESWWNIGIAVTLSVIFVLFLYLIRFCFVIWRKNARRKAIRKGERIEGLFSRGTKKVGMMVVLGSGGHTAEMIRLLESLDVCFYFYFFFIFIFFFFLFLFFCFCLFFFLFVSLLGDLSYFFFFFFFF